VDVGEPVAGSGGAIVLDVLAQHAVAGLEVLDLLLVVGALDVEVGGMARRKSQKYFPCTVNPTGPLVESCPAMQLLRSHSRFSTPSS